MWRAIGLAGIVFTAALLLGITNIFGLTVDTNLFNTGVKPSMIFGIWMLVVSWAIYKNRL